MKRCTACGDSKPETDFHRHPTCVGGRATTCKNCSKARVRAARDKRRAAMGEEAWKAHQASLVARRLARVVDDTIYLHHFDRWRRSGVTDPVAAVLAAEDAGHHHQATP